jgi:hypothetical protein
VRIGKRGFEGRVKGELRMEFGSEKLTSHAGLELMHRFLRQIGFFAALRASAKKLSFPGDLSFGTLVRLVVGLLIVGAKRLRHLAFVGDDPLLQRFVGLLRVPTERSLGRALTRMGWRVWPALDRLSQQLVRAGVERLGLRRWTVDIDGSVLTTGLQVERAERGFNPHHRKNPSYYPILATLAQTGHVIGHRNRRGNVHDSHRSAEFLHQAVRTLRDELGAQGVIETRVDGAFFQRKFLEACDWERVQYAVKVPMWPWLHLRGVVQQQRESAWQWIDRQAGVQGLYAWLHIAPWDRIERIGIYRKRVGHEPVKGKQLELFNPDDGYWEYSVVATNKRVDLRTLWNFQNGRGMQEKIIGELKSGLAFGSIPSQTYSANTAWQKLNVLTHNLLTTFQLRTTATPRPRSLKRTALYVLRSAATLRFEWLNRAARLVRPNGANVLRLADNRAIRGSIEAIEKALRTAA